MPHSHDEHDVACATQSCRSKVHEERPSSSPLCASDWSYLAEGNANVIFEYIGRDAYLSRCVLRLRKYKQEGSFTTLQVDEYFRNVLLPALAELADFLIPGALVPVGAELLCVCSDLHAQNIDLAIDSPWLGSSIDNGESHGLLLRNLRQAPHGRTLEFKPKWLTQSSLAPRDSRLCRTCALSFMRGKAIARPRFCPLDLVSHEEARLFRAVRALSADRSWHLTRDEVAALVRYFATSSLLQELRLAQIRAAENLALAMTLRDCSLYLMLNKSKPSITEVWIGDLDRKAESKYQHWLSVEKRLADEGWYYGRGLSQDDFGCKLTFSAR